MNNRPLRAPVSLPAYIDIGNQHLAVRLADLSLHGARIEGGLPYVKPGREVIVRFRLLGATVEARAEIRHVGHKHHVGLRFLRLPYEASMAIHSFLTAGGAAEASIDPARALA